MKVRKKTMIATYSLLTVAVITAIFLYFYSTPNSPQSNMDTPVPIDAPYLDPELPTKARVANLLSYMSQAEKIGQMTLVEKDSLKNISDVENYFLGALLSGSGAKPKENTLAGWKQMTDTYQAAAT